MNLHCILPPLAAPLFTCVARAMTVEQIKCDHCVKPFGVDDGDPVLSWTLQSNERESGLTACEIVAASSESSLALGAGDLWDSGRIVSDDSTQIRYARRRLGSSQKIFWKIRGWDEAEKGMLEYPPCGFSTMAKSSFIFRYSHG